MRILKELTAAITGKPDSIDQAVLFFQEKNTGEVKIDRVLGNVSIGGRGTPFQDKPSVRIDGRLYAHLELDEMIKSGRIRRKAVVVFTPEKAADPTTQPWEELSHILPIGRSAIGFDNRPVPAGEVIVNLSTKRSTEENVLEIARSAQKQLGPDSSNIIVGYYPRRNKHGIMPR